PTVANGIDVVDDRRVHVAGPKKIGVQRVHGTPFDGAAHRAQRLPEHLPAEDAIAADIAALAAKQVLLESLELEQTKQVGKHGMHGVLKPPRARYRALRPRRPRARPSLGSI